MATVTILLNERRADKHSRYPIIIMVRHGNKKRAIPTGYKVQKEQWKDGKVIAHADRMLMNAGIEDKRAEAMKAIYDADMNKKRLRLELIGKAVKSHCFIDYLSMRAKDYLSRNKRVMHIKTTRFAKEIKTCFGEAYFSDIDTDWIRKLDAWLIENGNKANTRAKKIGFYRGFYQNAIDEGKADQPNPFKSYKINKDPVKKEKLTLGQIKAIEDIPLSAGAIALARDLFLLSFYLKGSRFEDCVTLTSKDIRNDRVYWRANKGHKHLSVAIHPKLQAVLDRLELPLVPAMKDSWKQKKAVESFNTTINKNLKVVAGLADPAIPFNLTFHLARHSFAFLLKQHSNSIHTIQDALGHSSQRTTEIYLKTLDDQAIDPEVAKVYDY